MPRSNLVLAAVVIGLASANPDVARGQGDRLALTPDSSSSVVSEAGLPRGNWTETGHEIASRALAFGPDGKLYFIRNDPPGGAGKLLLSRLESNGEITDVSDLREGEDWIGDSVRDMTFGPEGRLYLLTLEYGGGYEWDLVLYAFERDIFELLYRSYLARGLSSSFRGEGLAPAPGGLWLLAQNRVSRFLFEGRVLLDSGSDLELSGRIHAADTDSTGALWVLTGSSHEDSSQTLEVFRLDPASGSARKGALDPIPTGPQPESSLAIDRRCPAGDTRRCVQGGRFALEATWRDAEGNADSARVAPAGSADTALLWFFEPSNWELMVKVLDGCEINGHFWVYAAASTDVEYQLSVTDLETGQLFTYQNPLGMASPAVDAIQAFSGCP